jgi:DeoR family fructose operon transcriptional repressor
MAEGYIPADRQARIQKMIQDNGIVKVGELSKLFGVTELTIRRDLDVLEEQGILDRTHGGAILRHRVRIEPLYSEKDQINRREKELIGRAVNLLVEEGDTLLINTGSTISQVLKNLSGQQIRVITSNAGAVVELQDPNIELILTGGMFRRQSNSLIGGFTQCMLQQVCGSKAIIGIDGISLQYGLTTPIHQEAEIGRLMIERTQGPVIVVADHSKLGIVSNFVTASLEAVSILVTDGKAKPEFIEELKQRDIEVVIAEEILGEEIQP